MPHSYDLTKLDESSFEHLANSLALRVLGAGHTGFGPGADGGRDGFFEGEAEYPSPADRWSGRWYIQAKFHRPHLTANAQAWLVDRIDEELKEFSKSGSQRTWPDNWIIVTNVDASGVPETGAFDKALKKVRSANSKLAKRFHIWGGAKVLQLLSVNPLIAEYYAHFLTPGHVLTSLYSQIEDAQASVKSIVRHLVTTQFTEQQYTKLEQAGSPSDTRPGIQRLFTDLPFVHRASQVSGMTATYLARTAAQTHKVDLTIKDTLGWRMWHRYPARARVWFVRGGPGQGKSTVTQYICQIQRAALILDTDGPAVTSQQLDTANEIRQIASEQGVWPVSPRIPVSVELRDFAKWFGERSMRQARGVLTYLAERITQRVEQPVLVGTLRRAFAGARWIFIFDGLDEVPSDVKDLVAAEVTTFIDDQLVACAADALIVCTSRPQGYSGQFDSLEAAVVELVPLNSLQALACAKPVLAIDRTQEETHQYLETLREALQSSSISEIMRTPLQSHIMAVVVRDGGRPPDRRWKLFANFYQVIKKREANRNLPDRRISVLLREGDKLLKSLHNRLGFELHARAETSQGALTSLARDELRAVVRRTVSELQEGNIDKTIDTLMTATTDRLVLVSTPETGEQVRFDIRPLQEFFAAEYIFEDVDADRLGERLPVIAGDSHWREVMHFVLSGIVESSRQTDLAVAVEKLSNVNDRVDGPARTFYRRLGLGGVIAGRLLNEGVLEHDRRVRHQFRRTIEPLFGSTEIELLNVFRTVQAPESANWLIDVLADTILEQSESESIGAAFVICSMLADNHKRVKEVAVALHGKSSEFKGCLFRMLKSEPTGLDVREGVGEWVLTLIFRSLASSDWRRLKAEGIDAAFSILLGQRVSLCSAGREAGLDPLLSDLIDGLRTKHSNRGGHAAGNSRTVGGILTERTSPPSDIINPTKWHSDVLKVVARAPGAFGLLYPIMALVLYPNAESDYMVKLQSDSSLLKALPYEVAAFLPDQLREGRAKSLSKLKPSWRYKPGYTAEHYLRPNGKTPDYEAVLDCLPEFALRFSTFPEMPPGTLKQFVSTDAGLAKVAEVCLSRPEIVVEHVGYWGEVLELEHAPSPKLRSAIRIAAVTHPPQKQSLGDIYTFELELPLDAAFLPHVIGCIANVFYRSSRPRLRSARALSPSQLAEKYVPAPLALCEVMRADSFAPGIRGSAAMIYLIHPGLLLDNEQECIDAIVANYLPDSSSWYLRSVACALDNLVAQGNARALDAIGTLLRVGSGDLFERFSLNPALERWRQTSMAPVQRCGIERF